MIKITFKDSIREYYEVFIKYAMDFMFGLAGIFLSLMMMIVYVIVSIFKKVASLIKENPVTTLAITSVTLFILLIGTYTNMKHKVKNAELERDSISYELSKIEQAFKGDTIIIGGFYKK